MNERLIQLQQEYARKLLCHVNPYTGLALVDDPAVITIQISNEESFIRGTEDTDYIPEMSHIGMRDKPGSMHFCE